MKSIKRYSKRLGNIRNAYSEKPETDLTKWISIKDNPYGLLKLDVTGEINTASGASGLIPVFHTTIENFVKKKIECNNRNSVLLEYKIQVEYKLIPIDSSLGLQSITKITPEYSPNYYIPNSYDQFYFEFNFFDASIPFDEVSYTIEILSCDIYLKQSCGN